MSLVFSVHVAATFFMTGIIWFVQIVHYPLFRMIPEQEFSKYEKTNMRLTAWVVLPAMLIELITGGMLLWKRPEFFPEVLF